MNISDVFLIIDFDGINVGLRDDFTSTFLEFADIKEAYEIASWYCAWINGVDL